MAGKHQRMSSKDVGNATGSSLSTLRAPGASDVRGVNLKINLDEFAQKLSELENDLTNKKCPIGKITHALSPELQIKFEIVLKNDRIRAAKIADMLHSVGFITSKDTIIRHRKAMNGQSGCRCYRES